MRRCFLLSLLFCALLFAAERPKYVFLFIGDGMSVPQRMLAEEYACKVRGTQICFNHFPCQAMTKTYSASSYVTDSAAAATAIACGVKTNNGRIGIDSQGNKLESVAYLAQRQGYKIGIVTSIYINHATPAGFYGRRLNRNMYYELGLDLIASGFDFFGGGGVNKNDDKKSGEYKGNIYDLAVAAGYKIARSRDELQALKPGDGKVLAYGAKGRLKYKIDRGAEESEPALSEYVSKAIEMLDNPNGFFMMVEGGLIDLVGHGNDAATNMEEVTGLDAAVRVALAFADRHPKETLVIVTGDHETGGMTMGFAGSGNHLNVERLGFQKISAGEFAKLVAAAQNAKEDFSFEDAEALLTKYFGFKFGDDKKDPMTVNEKELNQLKEAFEKKKLGDAARLVMMNKTGVGWTTGSHTSLPVLTTATGVGAEKFQGVLENTDISKLLGELLSMK